MAAKIGLHAISARKRSRGRDAGAPLAVTIFESEEARHHSATGDGEQQGDEGGHRQQEVEAEQRYFDRRRSVVRAGGAHEIADPLIGGRGFTLPRVDRNPPGARGRR